MPTQVKGEKHAELWNAISQLQGSVQFNVFVAHLEQQKALAMDEAATAFDMDLVRRAQGRYAALQEVLDHLTSAKQRRHVLESSQQGELAAALYT